MNSTKAGVWGTPIKLCNSTNPADYQKLPSGTQIQYRGIGPGGSMIKFSIRPDAKTNATTFLHYVPICSGAKFVIIGDRLKFTEFKETHIKLQILEN